MQKLALVLAFFCTLSRVWPQGNLITNPGFEDSGSVSNKLAGGWWLYEAKGSPTIQLASTGVHGGEAAVSLQATNDTKCVLVSAPFNVAPGDELRFQTWVRGQDLPPKQRHTCVGLAFRTADGRVSHRAYFETPVISEQWALVSGVAQVPPDVVAAEVHLGYTNAPGIVCYDDVFTAITSPVSFSLSEGAKPWPGEQVLALLVTSRQTNQLKGSISAVIGGGQARTVPVDLAPNTSGRIRVPITLARVGVHNYKLSLLDAGGKPLRVLQGKFHTSPPLVLYPACPCYHVTGQGSGATRIDARINLSPAKRARLGFAVEVTDGSGRRVDGASIEASRGDTVGVNVQVPVHSAGSFNVVARLLDENHQEVAAANTQVHVAVPEQSRVELGPDGFLRIAGRPHFTIGMYSCGQYEQMGKAGFSGTHSYQITTGDAAEPINPRDAELEQLLDKSLANGMRMMVELPRKAIEKARWEQVRRRIETFRYHPGLLCWGSEERVARGEAPLANIAALYRLVHELDPEHPLVLGDTKDVIQKFAHDRSDFFPDACMDVGIWWWYPIPLHAPDANGLDGRERPTGLLEPPSWLTTTVSKKPLWIAVQSYQQPRKDAPFPTPAEYRCMAYLSVIKGVKGLWFYTGSGQRDWQGKPAGLLNKPEEGHWDYVRQLVRELREFSPVIMSPACAEGVTLSPADAPLEWATRQSGGKCYLLAANKSAHAQTVSFSSSLFQGRRAQVLYEDHAIAVEGDSLKDSFAPFGVRIYRLE